MIQRLFNLYFKINANRKDNNMDMIEARNNNVSLNGIKVKGYIG